MILDLLGMIGIILAVGLIVYRMVNYVFIGDDR
ncbi:MAG: hypothetical protein AWU54_447 [Candidatus Frackibacter sp. T328-2]|nr:MAG: hypothetical protein AWU54_447 [Candidatus Frackibacter sp. T328-2]